MFFTTPRIETLADVCEKDANDLGLSQISLDMAEKVKSQMEEAENTKIPVHSCCTKESFCLLQLLLYVL